MIEVLVATCVLALGAVLIYEAFFSILDSHSYYSNYLLASLELDELLWETSSQLKITGNKELPLSSGRLQSIKNRQASWFLSCQVIDSLKEEGIPCLLYRLQAQADWPQGKRTAGFSRSTYVLYMGKE